MKTFQPYLKKGYLKKQNPNFAQVAKQLNRAQKDLKTAVLTLEHDPEWAATIAYQAMLRGGRSLLFAHGFLPADGAQHRTVVELTGKILGDEYASLARQFNKFRKKRNLFFYDSEDTGNIEEAKGALKVAEELLSKIKISIEKLNPQARLDFDIKICFVCTGNACRSQIAEGFAKKLFGSKAEVYSAGSKPLGTILPKTIQVMKEKGIDISNQRSKSLAEIPMEEMDYVISLCDSAAQYCPTALTKGQRLHWSFPDPYDPAADKDEETVLKDFRAVRDAIEKKLIEWLKK